MQIHQRQHFHQKHRIINDLQSAPSLGPCTSMLVTHVGVALLACPAVRSSSQADDKHLHEEKGWMPTFSEFTFNNKRCALLSITPIDHAAPIRGGKLHLHHSVANYIYCHSWGTSGNSSCRNARSFLFSAWWNSARGRSHNRNFDLTSNGVCGRSLLQRRLADLREPLVAIHRNAIIGSNRLL